MDDTASAVGVDPIPEADGDRRPRAAPRHADLAALASLLASALVAVGLDRPPPLEPLAAAIMEWTPVPVANWLLESFGAAGKPLALFGASAVWLATAGLLGAVASAGRLGRLALPAALLASALIGWVLTRAGGLPGVLTLVGGFWVVYGTLRGRRVRPAVAAGGVPHPIEPRRRALLAMAANASVLAVVSGLPVAASALRVRLFGRSSRPPLLAYAPPAARSSEFSLAGLTPEVTPLASFYLMSKNVADPVLTASAWSLGVHGRVRRSLSLSLDDLAAMPRTDQHVTMQCVSNPVGGPLWSATLFSGVRLADLLSLAEPLPDAAWVSFSAPDGHREQLSLDRALDPSILVAYGMGGDWLTPEHGFPARVLAAGLYGFRSVKWLAAVELLSQPRPGHWEERGWTAAEIHTTARVDLVQREPGGELLAAGVAFAGRRGVRAVEVRIADGAWQPAMLHLPPLGPAMWVQWRARLDAPTGRTARVEVRAIDGAGVPQDEAARGQFPNGATGLHGLSVTW
ncbi:MAG: molybdopterin-dependent oxidoreductase [Chloroflexi bacterium]|nr:molybdopterin-dependent oxidoreductase [Chloroflexota bacterium]